jgi:hypothetical protein
MKYYIKKLILDLLEKNDFINFVDIEIMLEENNINYEGDEVISPINYKNIYHWINMSVDYADSIIDLKNEKIIKFTGCHINIYFLSGKLLKFPIATKKEQYKIPHWLPVVISKNYKENEKL